MIQSRGWGVGQSDDFQLDLWISANSVGINTTNSLQKSRKKFVSRRKRSPLQGPGSYLGYIFIHFFSIAHFFNFDFNWQFWPYNLYLTKNFIADISTNDWFFKLGNFLVVLKKQQRIILLLCKRRGSYIQL